MILLFIIAFVKPICLPYEDDVDVRYHINDNGQRLQTWVAGWGATNAVSKRHRLLLSIRAIQCHCLLSLFTAIKIDNYTFI